MMNRNQNDVSKYYYDYWLIIITLTLLAIGLLLLASASMEISQHNYHTPFHFLYHQLVYILGGIAAAIFLLQVPIVFWEKIGGYLLLASMFLLLVVLLPGVGKQINGSIRWIGFGPVSLQVSEFAKFAVVIYSAGYFLRRQDELRLSIKGFIKPLVLLGIIAGLLLMEPDFGAVVVIVLTVIGMMFLAGARLWQFLILLLFVGGALGMLAIASPYRLMRLTSFLNPWAKPFDSGYQLVQSLIAFGRGGIFGVGLGNGIQKLFYLPEAHTDFLFAVLAEELGIIGEVIVIGLFGTLLARAFAIGRLAMRHKNNFAGFLAYGLGLLLILQVIINIGVNIGLLPTKGLTLPFMSYGGSSMLFNCAIVAILLRIYYELKSTLNLLEQPYFIATKLIKSKQNVD